jgi:hypothetical protein
MEILGLVKDVKALKAMILRARYTAAKMANAEMLKLYFAIGAYMSENSRNGKWGTGAIEAISEQLSRELPGLRGFSPTNMKNMRIFFEEWAPLVIRQPAAGELMSAASANCQTVTNEIRQPLAAKLGDGASDWRGDIPLVRRRSGGVQGADTVPGRCASLAG